MAKVIGIDLGTANTLICMRGKGIILSCPSVVSVNSDTREVVALGREASRMLGKAPSGLEVIRPLRDGVIADPDVTVKMLSILFRKIDVISFFSRPTVIVSVPYEVTEVEKRAVEDAVFEAGAGKVSLIPEPIAAAFGTGIRVNSARGAMIVDIGGGTTEVALTSLGGIVSSTSLRIAGNSFDEAIVNYIRLHREVLIGIVNAEELKVRIGAVHPSIPDGELEVAGRNLRTGLGAVIRVSSSEIREALAGELNQIVQAIKHTLELTPPELSSDIYDFGIMLTGGGAMLRGIDRLIEEKTGLKVRIAKKPLLSVCAGIGRMIDDVAPGNILQYRNR